MQQGERPIRQARLGVALAAFLAVLLLASCIWSLLNFSRAAAWVKHTDSARLTLQKSFGLLTDAETGMRGYLLTGELEYLEPYDGAVAQLPKCFARLERLMDEKVDGAQRARLSRLRSLSRDKLELVRERIELRRTGGVEAVIALVKTHRGKATMDAIRALVAEMRAAEDRLADEHAAMAARTSRTTLLLMIASSFALGPVVGGILFLRREEARRRESERAIARSERRFRSLVMASAQVVWTTDPAGLHAECSPTWGVLTGQTLEEQEGWGWLDALHPDDRERAAELWAQALATATPMTGIEYRLRRPDGTYTWTNVRAAPVVDEAGAVEGWIGMYIDVSARKEAEEARDRADWFREAFIGVLGHDLRNPLAAILASAQLGPRLSPERHPELFDRVLLSARNMERMIDQILDLTRARLGGGIVVERKDADLGACCAGVVEEVRTAARGCAIALEADEVRGAFDPDRMRQVIQNLLTNAVRHAEGGTPVRVRLSCEGGVARLSVHNRGAPIPADLLPAIFAPFRGLADRKQTRSGGLGLGLFIVQQIVSAHGGTIEVQSSAEEGTTFTVRLPLAAP